MEYIPHAPFSYVFIYCRNSCTPQGKRADQSEKQIHLEIIFHAIYFVSCAINIRNKAPRI